MSYEAGSKECRHLIEAKESLLLAMESLSNINSTDILQIQIKEIYNKEIKPALKTQFGFKNLVFLIAFDRRSLAVSIRGE